jgi:hypothetical protein
MAKCNIGNGRIVNFWTDLWEQNCLHHRFPHLITFVKHTNWNMEKVIHTEYLEDLFHLPLSQQAYEEFLNLEVICQSALIKVQEGNCDTWTYIWGNGEFSSRKAYRAMIGSSPTPKKFSRIWKSSGEAKHKLFSWLLLHDILNTRNLLKKKELPASELSMCCNGM